METPAGASRQIALPGQARDSSGPGLPLGDRALEGGDSVAPEEEEWGELGR